MTTEQPVRAPAGLPYGEKQKLEQAQQAIPLPAQPSPGGGGQAQAQPVERPDVFAPTGRPSEPLTAGAAAGAGPQSLELLPPDPVAHLRALYQRFPHEDLRRLLERASENRPSMTSAAPSANGGTSGPGRGGGGSPTPSAPTGPAAQTPQTGSPAPSEPRQSPPSAPPSPPPV